jgi:hypothetical protein
MVPTFETGNLGEEVFRNIELNLWTDVWNEEILESHKNKGNKIFRSQ